MSWQAHTNSHWGDVELFKLNSMRFFCFFFKNYFLIFLFLPNLKCPPLPESCWTNWPEPYRPGSLALRPQTLSSIIKCYKPCSILLCFRSGGRVNTSTHEHTVPEMLTIITPNAQLLLPASWELRQVTDTDLANRKWSNFNALQTTSTIKSTL